MDHTAPGLAVVARLATALSEQILGARSAAQAVSQNQLATLAKAARLLPKYGVG